MTHEGSCGDATACVGIRHTARGKCKLVRIASILPKNAKCTFYKQSKSEPKIPSVKGHGAPCHPDRGMTTDVDKLRELQTISVSGDIGNPTIPEDKALKCQQKLGSVLNAITKLHTVLNDMSRLYTNNVCRKNTEEEMIEKCRAVSRTGFQIYEGHDDQLNRDQWLNVTSESRDRI
ncbi:hypothetical protein GEV33_001882 [Tenebrio molitor]|uniref:Uncharacterized protein n=1 Tax=Tenebrio molitor TaxID=7067 RepID=A0A8J6HUH1_TENMO|nr:hypothetical protein GEV33_001882 [Tenebrio molitor]